MEYDDVKRVATVLRALADAFDNAAGKQHFDEADSENINSAVGRLVLCFDSFTIPVLHGV